MLQEEHTGVLSHAAARRQWADVLPCVNVEAAAWVPQQWRNWVFLRNMNALKWNGTVEENKESFLTVKTAFEIENELCKDLLQLCCGFIVFHCISKQYLIQYFRAIRIPKYWAGSSSSQYMIWENQCFSELRFFKINVEASLPLYVLSHVISLNSSCLFLEDSTMKEKPCEKNKERKATRPVRKVQKLTRSASPESKQGD